MTLLVVTAVAAEAEALRRGLPSGSGITVAPVGVGPAAAAAGTARLLAIADGRYRAVICAGIGGGIGLVPGDIALAARCIAADLGADSPDGFISLDELGFGSVVAEVDDKLLAQLRAALPEATVGDVLTVSTVTGTVQRLETLNERYPAAVAEGMEGYGVALAAREFSLPFGEVRAVSNPCGPRDRAAWDIPAALDALRLAGQALPGV